MIIHFQIIFFYKYVIF